MAIRARHDGGLGDPGSLNWDDMPDGVVVADETGRVVVFNSAAERVTGLTADQALGRPISTALPLRDLDGRQWWQCSDPYGGLATRTRQPERNLLLPDGREVLVTASYVRDRPLGPLARLVVVLRCTTTRERLERGRAELIATVAHELRSPLTSVKGFTATLLAKWERFTDDQKRLMLETVDADADRVTRLIAELLDIARIDSGRLELKRQPVDLAAVVERHVAGMSARGHPAARFAVKVHRPLPELWADPDKLDQVLANLLENAVRHGSGSVTVVAEGLGDGIAVSVTDEGPGIPAEVLGRVFTKFWRGNRRGGTGLGLYIVKGLVEAHGGSISVESPPGSGATFRFVLPSGVPPHLA